MSFLVIFVAIVLEFSVHGLGDWRSTRWSAHWCDWVTARCARFDWWVGWAAAAGMVLPPVIAVALALHVLGEWSPVLSGLTGLALLLCMLGPGDLDREVERYRTLVETGTDSFADLPAFITDARGTEIGPPTGDAELDAHRVELAALALAAERAWFQPLLWFFIAGPAAAVAVRLVGNLRHRDYDDASTRAAMSHVREVLEWLPARLTALAFGIAGTLIPVFDVLRSVGPLRWGVSGELVARAGQAATDNARIREVISGDPRIYRMNMVLALIKRALMVWLVLLAVFAMLAA